MAAIIFLIIGLITFAFGLYCLIKPDNFFLPYLNFYYNPKNPLKPVFRTRGFGALQIKKFGKTTGMLLWMRIVGATASIIGIALLLSYFQVI